MISSRTRQLFVQLAVIMFILLAIVLVYSRSRPVVADSRWTIHTAMSIIKEHNTDLDEYEQVLEWNGNYALEPFDGHKYSQFPIGTAVIAVPFVLAAEHISNLQLRLETGIPMYMEMYISSMIVALTAVIIYLIGRMFIDRRSYQLLLVFIFAFCTSAWSTVGLALWQHGPSMLMLSSALYLILLARDRPALIQFVSLPLSMSYVIRPTNSISILMLSIFIFLQYKRYFLRYVLWALPVALPFLLFNFHVYDSFLPPYYLPGRLGSNPDFFAGLLGNLVSPSRGLLIFTPVLFLSLAGIALKLRRHEFLRLDFFLAVIILLHWIAISTFDPWWAGHSFGPRFFSDMLPYFMYFMIPTLAAVSSMKKPWKMPLLTGAAILIAFSFFVHFRGATSKDVQEWNTRPDIYANQGRLWDWSQISFFKGILYPGEVD